jgi:hypothetical protein
MPFPSIEDVAPRVVKGKSRVVYLNDFTPITGVPKHRGCFVRWRVRSGGEPALDTIRLAHNTGWNHTETVSQEETYNNRPFGIIDSYPEKINDIDGGGVYGKLTVYELGSRVPVLVAFRFRNSSGNIADPQITLIGRRVWIYGFNVNIDGTVYTVPVVSDSSVTDMPSFPVRDIIRPLPIVRNMINPPRDYGWVVVAFGNRSQNPFFIDGAIPPSSSY